MLNICYCGTQDGYPHRADCPRPMFLASEAEERAWEKERRARRALIAADATADTSRPTITEADFERRADVAVQRRLTADPRYRNAENAEEQAEAEAEIEREVLAELEARFHVVA